MRDLFCRNEIVEPAIEAMVAKLKRDNLLKSAVVPRELADRPSYFNPALAASLTVIKPSQGQDMATIAAER
jgi:hypothetical protein